MWKGKATLCVYDDLSKQAGRVVANFRCFSPPPRREALPGYLFNSSQPCSARRELATPTAAGSLTALPIMNA